MDICISSLSELSVELYRHSSTLPPLTVHGSHLHWRTPQPSDCPEFKMENTFIFTVQLLDIYPKFLASLSVDDTKRSQPVEIIENQPLHAFSQGPDHASIFLLISCHNRLVDVYNQMFGHTRVVLERHSNFPPCIEGQESCIKMSIGAFEVPESTSITMQFLMIFEWAVQLTEHAHNLAQMVTSTVRRETAPHSARINEDMTSGLAASQEALEATVLACKKLRSRADEMTKAVDSLRTSLPKGLFKSC
jgi:hypothetical protein